MALENQTLPSEPILSKQLPVSTNSAKKKRLSHGYYVNLILYH